MALHTDHQNQDSSDDYSAFRSLSFPVYCPKPRPTPNQYLPATPRAAAAFFVESGATPSTNSELSRDYSSATGSSFSFSSSSFSSSAPSSQGELQLYKTERGGGVKLADSPLAPPSPSPVVGSLRGLLRIRIKRGVNLAVRDFRTSDPYCVVRMGKQKVKTSVIKKDVNPEWNEDLTLYVTDPDLKVKLSVYDYNTFSFDDKMGDAEFFIQLFMEVLKMNVSGLPNGTIVTKIHPSRANCLADETCITCVDGKVIQDMCLRLKNVECGEVELQLQWIDLPHAKGF